MVVTLVSVGRESHSGSAQSPQALSLWPLRMLRGRTVSVCDLFPYICLSRCARFCPEAHLTWVRFVVLFSLLPVQDRVSAGLPAGVRVGGLDFLFFSSRSLSSHFLTAGLVKVEFIPQSWIAHWSLNIFRRVCVTERKGFPPICHSQSNKSLVLLFTAILSLEGRGNSICSLLYHILSLGASDSLLHFFLKKRKMQRKWLTFS